MYPGRIIQQPDIEGFNQIH